MDNDLDKADSFNLEAFSAEFQGVFHEYQTAHEAGHPSLPELRADAVRSLMHLRDMTVDALQQDSARSSEIYVVIKKASKGLRSADYFLKRFWTFVFNKLDESAPDLKDVVRGLIPDLADALKVNPPAVPRDRDDGHGSSSQEVAEAIALGNFIVSTAPPIDAPPGGGTLPGMPAFRSVSDFRREEPPQADAA